MTQSKPFAVFDIDGTVARTSLYLASLHAMKRRGMLSAEDSKAIDEALQKWLARDSDRSFEDYVELCIQIFNKALPSIKVSAYREVQREVLAGFSHKIYRYTTDLIKELKAKGYKIFAVSGSEMSLVSEFAKQHGFDDWIGNTYEDDGTYFTGKIGTTFRDKTLYVEELRKKHDCILAGSVAVGDTHGDIEMLEMVERPTAFNPNKTLFEHAKSRGWQIVIERKNVIYKLERQRGHYHLADTD